MCHMSRGMRALVTVLTLTLAMLPVTSAPASEGPQYVHHDCVGSDPPITRGPHRTHIENVDGFLLTNDLIFFTLYVGPRPRMSSRLGPAHLVGPGICPAPVDGPILPVDFTGSWRLQLFCGPEFANPGHLGWIWTLDVIGGLVLNSHSNDGIECFGGSDGAPISYDLRIVISTVYYQGVGLRPTGGALLSVEQSPSPPPFSPDRVGFVDASSTPSSAPAK